MAGAKKCPPKSGGASYHAAVRFGRDETDGSASKVANRTFKLPVTSFQKRFVSPTKAANYINVLLCGQHS